MSRPLLLIACSARKLEGAHSAIDLYQGVLFDVLRKWMPAKNAPEVFIISANYGLIAADTVITGYDRQMDEERKQELIVQGVQSQFDGKHFSEVFIAGGELYREVAQSYVAHLREEGGLAPDAKVRNSSGRIGEHRSLLGQWLRYLGAKA